MNARTRKKHEHREGEDVEPGLSQTGKKVRGRLTQEDKTNSLDKKVDVKQLEEKGSAE